MHEVIQNVARIGSVRSVTVIGSTSPMHKDPMSRYSDVDLVVLVRGHELRAVRKRISLEMDRALPGKVAVECWGHVSAASLGAEVIHLLLSPLDEYRHRSILFRKSASKYPPAYGTHLAHFVEPGFVRMRNLEEASDGPKALYNMMVKGGGGGEVWCSSTRQWISCTKHSEHSNVAETAIYSVLQSARNVLRYLRCYEEFSGLDDLAETWKQAKLPGLDDLVSVINAKKLIRQVGLSGGVDSRVIVYQSKKFLDGLMIHYGWRDVQ